MEYKIEIYYQTGNSYAKHEAKDFLELTFENIEVAKQNLQRIKEHYQMYLDVNKYENRKRKQGILEENKEKDWFVYKAKLYSISKDTVVDESRRNQYDDCDLVYLSDNYFGEQCLKLKADNGNDFQLSAFWVGYFEKLYRARIVIDESDLEIEF